MLRSYLKIALRNLMKHKGYSFINITGLAIGIAACLMILLYVSFELSYDDFHRRGEQIYRVRMDQYQEGEHIYMRAKTFGFVGPQLQAQFPEVDAACRLINLQGIMGNFIMRHGERTFAEAKMYYADASALTMFSFELLAGDPRTALSEPYSAVITESAARRYFGDESPLGKNIIQNDEDSYRITGVLKDIPENSHLQFTFLLSMSSLEHQRIWQYMPGWADWLTYILLAPGADSRALSAKLAGSGVLEDYFGQERDFARDLQISLQPLREIHLHSHLEGEAEVNGSAVLTCSLLAVAGFILLIAWINYVNLSTARALDRGKEVGVRKVAGARRHSLIVQFLLESFLLNALAGGLAILLVFDQLPFFSRIIGQPLTFSVYGQWELWAVLLTLLVLGMLIASLYPALLLSAVSPIVVLKGKFRHSAGKLTVRKALVIFQFAASVILMVGTVAVYQQLSFMRSQELGIDIRRTLIVPGPGVADSAYGSRWQSFKNAMLSQAGISSVTASTNIPGRESTWGGTVRRLGEEADAAAGVDFQGIDHDFIAAYRIPLLAGRNFSPDFPSDEAAVLVNEAALRLLRYPRPEAILGEKITAWRNREFTVIGVLANHHQLSLRQAHLPTVYFLRTSGDFYSLKLQSTEISAGIATIRRAYEKQFPGNPFDYFFLDDYFDRQYQAEQRYGEVLGFFAGLAIMIACLGLFALSAYTAMKRTKEIGIRKVLGATPGNIITLLSKEFLLLVMTANLVALPLAGMLLQRWLENYAFRISPGWELFAFPAGLVMIIALATIGFHAVKAALGNPADALRYE